MSNSNYFDKFMDDLEKRVQKNQERKTISKQEKDLQDRRRLRVRRHQELWQNRIKWRR